jgi:multiple sugar transport system permease protein
MSAKPGRLAREEARWGYAFILLPFVGFVLFALGPLLASAVISLHEYSLLGNARWVGTSNFQELWADARFRQSLGNTAFFLLGIPIGMAISLSLALALNRMKGAAFFRSVYFLPSVTSIVAVSLLWMWLYNPEFGWLNGLLGLFGIKGPAWLQDPAWAKPSLILMGLWMGVGYSLLLFLAGLQTIPNALLEAASIDGAGPFTRFWRVTWPLLTPTTFFVAVTSVIGTLQMFGQVYMMTGGGPDFASSTTMYYLWEQAFQWNRMGYASAMAWVLGAIVLIMTMLQFRLSRRWVHYEG